MPVSFRTWARGACTGLALTLLSGLAYGQSNTPLSGSYAFLVNQTFLTAENEKGLAFVGVMNLDGAGKITATTTFQNGAGPRHAAETGTTPLAGTYSTNPDGTGKLKMGIEGDLTITFAMVIIDGGQSLQLLGIDCSIGSDSCGGPYTAVFSGVARAIKGGASSLKGSYGFELNAEPVPTKTGGVLKFDGSGNATMSYTRVGTSSDPALTTAPMSSGSMSGTYTVNPDGSGVVTLKAASAQSPDLSLAFVVTDGGSGLLLLRTESGTPNSNTESGSARLQ